MDPIEGDHLGTAEREWIMATLKPLCGGRVWKTAVPDGVTLGSEVDGTIPVYIIVRFARPLAIRSGRNIGTGEKGQPHQLSFTVLVVGGDADDVEATLTAATDLLEDARPSLTSNRIEARGGFGYGNTEAGSRPTRIEEAGFFRTVINI
ncbi:hypothetical protein MRBLMI12_000513 [Microbacterium sp. LMI12-1-1.1]|uniref:hypothetical protein n=1 Tax=Microbacterium sp. LMI12-1-1.1 TaxID=3135225 RepID=UPI003448783F